MGDYAPAQLFLFSVPAGKEAAVLEVVDEWFDGVEWEFSGVTDLVLPGPYTAHEARTTIAGDLGSALAELGCAFDLWQDPKYEFPGEVFMHVPEVGTWTGPCDSQGEPYVGATQIDKLLEEWRMLPNPTGDALAKMLDDHTGGKVRRSIERMHSMANQAAL